MSLAYRKIIAGPLQDVDAEDAPEARPPPIHRLPPELLWLVASYFPKSSLINMTHVSHHLRVTLLCDPHLWTDLSFLCAEEAYEFLRRSGSNQISVLMCLPFNPHHKVATKFLREHAGRINALSINCALPLPPMPSLRTLKMICNYYLPGIPEYVYTFKTLTTLIIEGGGIFPFNTPQLTKLQVNFSQTPAVGKLLLFLACCPLLEELEMNYGDNTIHIPAYDSYNIVELPCLHLYSHSTSRKRDVSILDKLSLLPSCSVVFNYWNGPMNAYDNKETLCFYNPSPLAELKRVKLKTSDVGATMELIDVKNHRVHMVQGKLAGEKINGWIVDNSYVDYLKTLNTCTVKILCIEGPPGRGEDNAEDVLSSFGGISTLVLSGSNVTSYIIFLVPHIHKNTATGPWLCPELKELTVCTPGDQGRYGERAERILFHLANTVEKRSNAGMKLESISLFVCNPSEVIECSKHLERLKKFVGKVDIKTRSHFLGWDIDNYFFCGLNIRRDRYSFKPQRDKLLALYRWK